MTYLGGGCDQTGGGFLIPPEQTAQAKGRIGGWLVVPKPPPSPWQRLRAMSAQLQQVGAVTALYFYVHTRATWEETTK